MAWAPSGPLDALPGVRPSAWTAAQALSCQRRPGRGRWWPAGAALALAVVLPHVLAVLSWPDTVLGLAALLAAVLVILVLALTCTRPYRHARGLLKVILKRR